MNNIITKTIRIIAAVTLLVLAVGTFNLPASAQNQKAQPGKDFTIGKKGEVHFNIQVKAGDVTLAAGEKEIAEAQVAGEAFKHLL